MRLRDILEATADHHQMTVSGCVIVHPTDASRPDYYRLEDYRVSSATSGGNLWLVPMIHDPILVREFEQAARKLL